ncbi:MAG: alpha/beta fold hydrolase [Aquabacterium sp.]
MSRWILRLVGGLMMLTALAFALSRAPDRPVQSLVPRWAPPPSQFIQVGTQLVHLRDEGITTDTEPLVLIHGTSASLHTWEGWVRALKGQRRVITLDLPGFGLTGPSADADYRGDTYARFVLALLDQLQVRRFSIGGNSLGGEVAWRVAAMAPQRVQRLILVDAAGHAFEPEHIPIGFRLARMPVVNRILEGVLPRGAVEQSVREVYGDPTRVTQALVDRYFELMLREGNRRALVQRFAQIDVGADAARIRTLRLPTLILWGGQDRLIPPQWGRQFQQDIPGSELVVFDALGHVPHEEDPAATVQSVLRFLGVTPRP